MPRPGVIRPRAPLVRDAVRIDLAAQDGEIAENQVTKTARYILSFMTETERVSLSSRSKIEGYNPPVDRFREAAEAFITKFGLDDMLASFEEHVHDEELPPDLEEDPPEIDDDTAGSQHSSSSEAVLAEREDSAASAKPEYEGSEDDASNSGQPTTRKRKVSPSFQSLRSPSDHRYTMKERMPDLPDSPPDWGGVEEERDSSEAESTHDHILDEVKGKEKAILLPWPPALVSDAEREELEREREIRAKHRVRPSEPISASVLISALESQPSAHGTQRDNRLVTTPPISHRPSSSTSSSSPSTDQHRRFSVDELGSPSFKPRFAPKQKYDPSNQAASDIERRDASPEHRAISSSPNDSKVEDAPKPITPHHIPGSWIPSRTIHFGEFKGEIPLPRRQPVYKEIDLPDALGEAQPSNEIDLPDAPEGQRRTEEEQLFYSEGAQPRVSLPPTPEDRENNSTRHSFTPTYPQPATYGSFLPTGLFNVGSYATTKIDYYRHKSTQTEDKMTAKKLETLEEMMKHMMLANEKRDARLDMLLAQLTAASAPEEAEQTQRDAVFRQLEEERVQTLAAAEAELKAKYEATGFEYGPQVDQCPARDNTYVDRSES
jgi:hypothetical protein